MKSRSVVACVSDVHLFFFSLFSFTCCRPERMCYCPESVFCFTGMTLKAFGQEEENKSENKVKKKKKIHECLSLR